MRHMKRMIVLAVTAILLTAASGTVMAATAKTVRINAYQNEKGEYKNVLKGYTTAFSQGSFSVEVTGGTDSVKKLKVNKKGLTAKVTSARTYSYANASESSSETRISYYATKAGSYKISFEVAGKKYSFSVTVYNKASVTDKVKFGSQTLRSHTVKVKGNTRTYETVTVSKASKKSGKLKITPAGPYKVTGLVVATVNKKGNISYKKVKNGKKITLSKGYLKNKYDNSTYTAGKKYTYVYVSYKNKITGETRTYSVGTDPDTKKKAVKCVSEYAGGDTSTGYYTNGSGSTLTIWQY